jgi:hypothetical protein
VSIPFFPYLVLWHYWGLPGPCWKRVVSGDSWLLPGHRGKASSLRMLCHTHFMCKYSVASYDARHRPLWRYSLPTWGNALLFLVSWEFFLNYNSVLEFVKCYFYVLDMVGDVLMDSSNWFSKVEPAWAPEANLTSSWCTTPFVHCLDLVFVVDFWIYFHERY